MLFPILPISAIRGCLLAILVFAIFLRAASAEDRPNTGAYVVMNGHWGVSIVKESGRQPIITYLPTGMLIYERDRSSPYNDGDERIAATTQDGVRLYLIDKFTKPISIFGSRDFMAHADFEICVDRACNPVEDITEDINAGGAFSLNEVGDEVFEVVSNKSSQQDIVVGYISKNTLDNYTLDGTITDIRQKHPRYSISVEKSILTTNHCSIEPMNQLSIEVSKSSLVDEIAPVLLGYGTAEKQGGSLKLSIQKEYGKEGAAKEFRIYSFVPKPIPSGSPEFEPLVFLAEVSYACDEDSERIFIEKVRIVAIEQAAEEVIEIFKFPLEDSSVFEVPREKHATTIRLEPWGTPRDMAGTQFGRYPYLWSVNTPEQYFEIMEQLSEKFQDRSIAGFFLSEFNRSCPRKKRRGAGIDDKCVDHSYVLDE